MSDRMQVSRYSTPVFAAQASFEERAKLTNGQAVTRPYTNVMYEQTYTRGSDMTMQTLTETNETLTVNTSKATPFAIDDLDAVQSNFKLMQEYSDRAMRALNKAVDADYLGEVVNATSTVDAGDVGGSSGSPITLDATNVLQIYAAALRKLQLQNVDIIGAIDPRQEAGNQKPGGKAGFANLNPWFLEQLTYSLAGRETIGGDQIGRNGYTNSYFGFDNYVTTNGTWTGVFSMATQPTDGDTVTINGVTFTFKTTLGSTAGNVLIGGSADVARANLAALINAPGTTTANGVALSQANQDLLLRMTAANDNSANTMTVIAEGYGYVVVSETLTDATDAWTSEISHQMFGQKGAVDMVLQAKPQVKVSEIPKQLGNYVKPYVLYGQKTFSEGAKALVNVEINSSTWA